MIRTTLLGCALIATMFTTAALAQEPTDQRTYFTFSAPFELPGGKTLPAGKYTFRIVDSPSNRHIVQILNEEGTEVHTTLMAIPAQRQDPPSEPEIRFMEAPANMPPAIKTWWYPGRSIGHEFIYPKDHARRLAAAQSEPVLTVAGSGDDMNTDDLARIGKTGEETEVGESNRTAESTTASAERTVTQPASQEPAPAPRVDPAPAPTPRVENPAPATQSQARTPAPAPRVADTARDADQTRSELPRTASMLPLVGLVGLLSMTAAAVVRRMRRA